MFYNSEELQIYKLSFKKSHLNIKMMHLYANVTMYTIYLNQSHGCFNLNMDQNIINKS